MGRDRQGELGAVVATAVAVAAAVSMAAEGVLGLAVALVVWCLHEVVAVKVDDDLLLSLASHMSVHAHKVLLDAHDLGRLDLRSCRDTVKCEV